MEEHFVDKVLPDKERLGELIVRVQQGEREAFEELYDVTFHWVCSMVYRRLDATYAEDCVQDIYLKLFEKAHAYSPEKGEFSSWFRSVVVNQTTDNWRKQSRIQNMETSAIIMDESGEYVEMEFPGNHFEPETESDRREVANSLKELLRGLNPEQTQAILLHYVHQKKDREIAEDLGISENTVKSRINKGMKRMAKLGKSLRKDGYVFFGMAPVVFGITAMTMDPDIAYASMISEQNVKYSVIAQLEADGAWMTGATDIPAVNLSNGTAVEMITQGAAEGKGGLLSSIAWKGITIGLTGMVVVGGIGVTSRLQNNGSVAAVTEATESMESSMEEEGLITDEGTEAATIDAESTSEETTIMEESTVEETSAVEEETTPEETTEAEETTKKETAAKAKKSTTAAAKETAAKAKKSTTAAEKETTAKSTTAAEKETTAKSTTVAEKETTGNHPNGEFGSGTGW